MNQKEKSSHHTWRGSRNNDNSHDIWNQTDDDDSHKIEKCGSLERKNWTIKMGRKFFMNVIDKFKDIQMKEIWCEILIVLSSVN